MNNTKTKQIIAGLPEDAVFHQTIADMEDGLCITGAPLHADDLKALADAVPEWVPVKSESALCQPAGLYWTSFWIGGVLMTTHHRLWGEGDRLPTNTAAYMRIPEPQPYQEDKDDIEEKIRKVTERGDAITGDEFERERR